MRGLIYKDISIFFKSIDKKLILIATAAIVLLIFNAGIYAGLFASVMFAMTIGMEMAEDGYVFCIEDGKIQAVEVRIFS